ncbi:TetR/AcrR family transcriptional regulator [Advenella sp. WQ 585]|uniref:TetR/AcrR family transcriptional regulator n=1 Tax=Advenella mandrilli TaxID=2800330 RepID=A0ABS1EET9_9BURK|nr:helix-turn-helix domain-containing protein [Advenella mandrilli]MBK1780402.1 TetR/AcrR family transcriptional regulator [Advenella mandrilli]NLY34619.1 TetR/AcrR family transcriptional regulator [Alcaligenaceae bacterium]
MRMKSEARREAILDIALDLFCEVGFEAASMSQIAARLGGSKATLYNYFSSKEELLLEALLASEDKYHQEMQLLLQQSNDIFTQLHSFVVSLLKVLNSPKVIQVLRVAISVGGTSDIGRRFHEGSYKTWLAIADLLHKEMNKRGIHIENTHLMAMHLRDLCQTDLICNLLGAGTEMTDEQVEQKAAYIVEIFFHTYSIK